MDASAIVFADDWGRHPSSCQHLIRHCIADTRIWWVNTIGMRRARLSAADLRRAAGVVTRWIGLDQSTGNGPHAEPDTAPEKATPSNLTVLSPMMYPGFRNGWQRTLNRRRVQAAVSKALQAASVGEVDAVVTTLPITADLVGKLPARRWVYYAVDDFSVWPGLDSDVMDTMERELVAKVDHIVAVSETIANRMRSLGAKHVDMLTHGVDIDHFTSIDCVLDLDDEPTRKVVFWGLIDQRLDLHWLEILAKSLADHSAKVLLAGPVADSAPGLQDKLAAMPGIELLGPLPYEQLPQLACEANVMVMPYVDAPVTHAMAPLKLLEYLATYRSVVVRDLPATRPWSDCCDIVTSADELAAQCLTRIDTGLPETQRRARQQRLPGESWSEKSRTFKRLMLGQPIHDV